MELNKALSQFQSPHVKDLAWAILSPTLMQTHNPEQNFSADFFQKAYQDFLPHLEKLDLDPEPLRDFLNKGDDKRLGPYFERLWIYWLDHNDQYKCLAHNQQIQDKNRTLGEMDLIVKNHQTQQIEHWELSIKFYLGIPPFNQASNWIGPSLRDRLDIKYKQLTGKQLLLPRNKTAQQFCNQQGWKIQQSRSISKGCLFYPYPLRNEHPSIISTHHLKGYWTTQHQFAKEFNRLSLKGIWQLNKKSWMNLESNEYYDPEEFTKLLAHDEIKLPCQFLIEHNHAIDRLFIVSDQWQQQAKERAIQ